LFRGSGANLTALAAANITAGGVLPALDGSALTNLNATSLATGTVPTARLGTGTANSTTVLYGDQTYKTAAPMTLLKAGSGTSTAVGATNVDTIAISGLTALDTLVIYATLESTTAGTADPQIYNVTDSQKWIDVFLDTAPNMAANSSGSMTIEIRQRQSGSTSIAAFNYGLDVSNIFTGDWNRVTTTTAWTGSFTLALRHTGVTATGTFRYNWAVYKVAGQ
jgi:hypothetical protein